MRQIGIVIYDQAEVLDFSGPYEVLATAARLCETPPWTVALLSEHRMVTARGGLVVQSHHALEEWPALDVLLVSGGVHTRAMENRRLLAAIADAGRQAQWVTSVCTGAFLLARAGLLDGRRVTTHWEDVAELRRGFPALTVEENRRWVEDGNRLTSAGISAGIDMTLHLVETLHSRELAQRTARQMDYHWQR
ncbi:AraC family transcriptional regulator [Alcanivorax hongdengensis A-11-3]|uniref:AraC family transcriptional regulator n=1 Tax=Alcanivorax hongdengensis A-11-3 TaxID=1177179 RepID=L0WBS4_9GAMM|nr:DJ-1/PfpI family protein [Alcanivorax hongdengensis]EKF73195.1 AraC family transcriptional regulator [Alcanivorax hongdengensis A-11-3]